MKSKIVLISLFFIAGITLLSALAPWVTSVSFEEQDMNRILMTPNSINWFGTDELGRDLYSRVIYGARVSMAVGLYTSLLALLFGTLYGAISGFFGGLLDSVLMRAVDILQSIPPLVLMILVSVFLNSRNFFENEHWRSLTGILIALSLVSWVSIARLVRAQVRLMREMSWVEAARAIGASHGRVIVHHIFPNILGPLIVMLTLQIPNQLLYESFLSFLGVGLQPPYSSWGVLAHDGVRSLRSYPHLIIFPGLVLFLTMLAFGFLGEVLRDVFDPRFEKT